MVYFTTVVVLWYIIIRAMQNFKQKLKKDKDTAGFVDYITPRGSQFFGPVAHHVVVCCCDTVVPVGSAMDRPPTPLLWPLLPLSQ